jgi:hypothetical protein
VSGDPNPLVRWNRPMDCLRDICLSWLKKLTSPGQSCYCWP